MADFDDFDEYWERRGPLGYVYPRWQIAVSAIPDGARVLDLGCGSGGFLEYLRSERPNVVGVGADSSAQARAMTEEAGFETLDLDAMSDEIPEGFDYITAFEVLEHLPDAEGAIGRWTAAAGEMVILSVPNVGHIGNRIRLMFFGRFPLTNCVYHIKEHLRHWTPKDFREWTRRLGIRVLRAEGQYGLTYLWRRFPTLFAFGMVYFVDRDPSAD